MPLGISEIITLIDAQLAKASHGNRVAEARRALLQRIRTALLETGFPHTPEQRQTLSLVPLIFQEANYDGIGWTEHRAPLKHLEPLFAIDVAVQTGGCLLQELDSIAHRDYVLASFATIKGPR